MIWFFKKTMCTRWRYFTWLPLYGLFIIKSLILILLYNETDFENIISYCTILIYSTFFIIVAGFKGDGRNPILDWFFERLGL